MPQKDYYSILVVSKTASDEDIKKAYRKRAMQYHPDKNPGHEREAEARFKDINEAYGVLCDPGRRGQYDLARRGGGGSYTAPPGFGYSQQDIFQSFFSNQAAFNEMSQMFAQAGLRFDEDLLRQVFFSGQVRVFQFGFGPGGFQSYSYRTPTANPAISGKKPGFMTRIMSRLVLGFFRLVFKSALGPPPPQELDYHHDLEISAGEAEQGAEKKAGTGTG